MKILIPQLPPLGDPKVYRNSKQMGNTLGGYPRKLHVPQQNIAIFPQVLLNITLFTANNIKPC